jgi:hypothetical protein
VHVVVCEEGLDVQLLESNVSKMEVIRGQGKR